MKNKDFIAELYDDSTKGLHKKLVYYMDMLYYEKFKDIIEDKLDDIIEEELRYREDDIRNDEKERIMKELDGLDDDFMKGVEYGIEVSKICPHCRKNIIESVHHVMPRKYGGGNYKENIIPLCNKCHDKIEILTDELLVGKHCYTVNDLLCFIRYGFPNENK